MPRVRRLGGDVIETFAVHFLAGAAIGAALGVSMLAVRDWRGRRREIDVHVGVRPAETTVTVSAAYDYGPERWSGFESHAAAAEKIRSLMKRWKIPPRRVHIDAAGAGGGFVMRLRAGGLNVDAFLVRDGRRVRA